MVEKHIYVINLASMMMTDEKLMDLLSSAEEGSIILLEDIDSAISKIIEVGEEDRKESHVKASTSFLSYSGILNALDGVGSQEGRILFLTTNHIEKLPNALLRPGRIDKKVYFGLADKFQIEKLFLKFFPENTSEAKLFAEKLKENQFSMAQLQSFLMEHKSSSQEAISNLAKLSSKSESF